MTSQPSGCPVATVRPLNGSSEAPAAPRVAVPKMGVRARIAEWPPKRDPTPPTTGASGSPRGPPGSHHQPLKALHRLARRRSKDVEFHHDPWPRATGLGLRQRSSSEVTLSECDPEEAAATGSAVEQPRAANPSGLFREYGSTSSIDVQGLSEQSFLEMLNQFRANKGLGAVAHTNETVAHGKEKTRWRSPKGTGAAASGTGDADSIFKKLRSIRSEAEAAKEPEEAPRPWLCQKSFAHYDVQSLLFDLNAVMVANRATVAAQRRRNTTTGASAASVGTGGQPGGSETPVGGHEELNQKENLEHDGGDNQSNELLLSCPHFRNEIGGAAERDLGFARATAGTATAGPAEVAAGFPDGRPSNAGVNVLEGAGDAGRSRGFSLEHEDLGARYYREHFHGKEHSNYFGLDEKLGPVAISIKREKLEDHKDHGPQYQYRIIFRTSELLTLRGSILEDATPTATKHGSVRGLPLRDALEYVVPELNIQCLRLAVGSPKVPEQLLKLDEQGLCRRHKVGILYCKAGQSSEEEMYNNEEAGPPFEEFLHLLGEKVSLRSFSRYSAQLDTKTDSTGTHSLYTTYQDYEIMFHVSTLLPYTPHNRQQLLRKRHIGNDIVTIIFQEPGALPFTPQNIRSHFQHVFIIVRVHQPCSDNVCYSVAVTRSKDVPPFGPPIPTGVTFRKSDLFRDFLLAKVINGENAAHKSHKFRTMATRTRREYLKDLAQNYVSTTAMDSASKFNLISLASKKREKTKARAGAEQLSAGAISWRVAARDFAQGSEIPCILGVSSLLLVLVDLDAKEVVFNCFCRDVIGWSLETPALKIFYGRGDHVLLRASGSEELKEIVQRLKVMTSGCETVDMTLRRNGLGQLGFHVKADGTVAEVEDYGFAWQAGLRQGSRLVEICKVAVVTLSHDQMIDLLRTSVTVKVVIVPPHEDGTPRKGLAEASESPDAKGELSPSLEAAAAQGQRPPFRSGAGWTWSGPGAHGGSTTVVATKKVEAVASGDSRVGGRGGKLAVGAVAYREPQGLQSKRPVSFPETPHPSSSSSSSSSPAPPYRQPSGSFSALGSAGTSCGRYRPPQDRFRVPPDADDSSSGPFSSHEATLERPQVATEESPAAPPPVASRLTPLWHLPPPRRPPGGGGGGSEGGGSDGTETTPLPLPPGDPEGTPRTWGGGNSNGGAGEGKGTPSLLSTPPPPQQKAGGASPPKGFLGQNKPAPPSWKRSEDPKNPPPPKNIFGQPRLRASLRDLRPPRRSHRSSVEADLKRLLLMDPAPPRSPPRSPPRPPHRTLSDESLCGGGAAATTRRDTPPARAGGTTPPHPEADGAPPPCGGTLGRRQPPCERKGTIRRLQPGLMPLPDPAAGLEWASLVSAAKAYEVQRAVSLFSLAEPDPPHPETPPSASSPEDLPGKVSQLEAMLKQLHSDLQKEKQDKVVLQAEVATLRQNNRRLQQESHSAARQLRRFARLLAQEQP